MRLLVAFGLLIVALASAAQAQFSFWPAGPAGSDTVVVATLLKQTPQANVVRVSRVLAGRFRRGTFELPRYNVIVYDAYGYPYDVAYRTGGRLVLWYSSARGLDKPDNLMPLEQAVDIDRRVAAAYPEIRIARRAVEPGKTDGPIPRGNMDSWVTGEDYPSRPLRERAGGEVQLAVAVDDNGRVSSCHILASTGNADLDDASCSILQRRARFRPPTVPAERSMVFRFRWSVGEDGTPEVVRLRVASTPPA